VLITIFTGIGLVFREMEKRTIFMILSKPVQRSEFLFGKFTGLALTLLLVLVGLASVFYLLLFLKGDPNPRFLLGFYLMYLEWLMIGGIAILFSSFSTPLLSGMLTLASFFAGHLSASLLMLERRLDFSMAKTFLSGLYYVLPNLEMFNLRAQLVHDVPVAANYYLEATLYWLLYLGAVLLFSIRIFQKKDLV
jgi:ABC-type transport system involved in multi-copper enzyme maturation permease subunit